MADYFTSTVVQPDIPLADISPWSTLFSALIFDIEESRRRGLFFRTRRRRRFPPAAVAALRDAWGPGGRHAVPAS